MYRRPETKAAEEKVYKQKQIGEFMTTWKDFPRPGLAAWAERQKAGLMGTAKSTHYTPRFRPFDMLSIPNQSLVILENEYHRIGVESVVGCRTVSTATSIRTWSISNFAATAPWKPSSASTRWSPEK